MKNFIQVSRLSKNNFFAFTCHDKHVIHSSRILIFRNHRSRRIKTRDHVSRETPLRPLLYNSEVRRINPSGEGGILKKFLYGEATPKVSKPLPFHICGVQQPPMSPSFSGSSSIFPTLSPVRAILLRKYVVHFKLSSAVWKVSPASFELFLS